jgi:hypothetical protein
MDAIDMIAAAMGVALAIAIAYLQIKNARASRINDRITRAIALSAEARAAHWEEMAAMHAAKGDQWEADTNMELAAMARLGR